jgi:hypothetical protein
MPGRDTLAGFVAWCGKNITGDEEDQAQTFLDREVAAKIERASPVMLPGVTRNYPAPQRLVTEDCIRPTGWANLLHA